MNEQSRKEDRKFFICTPPSIGKELLTDNTRGPISVQIAPR
jgi:hypothetical protein